MFSPGYVNFLIHVLMFPIFIGNMGTGILKWINFTGTKIKEMNLNSNKGKLYFTISAGDTKVLALYRAAGNYQGAAGTTHASPPSFRSHSKEIRK
jgi:hypothetical protein